MKLKATSTSTHLGRESVYSSNEGFDTVIEVRKSHEIFYFTNEQLNAAALTHRKIGTILLNYLNTRPISQ